MDDIHVEFVPPPEIEFVQRIGLRLAQRHDDSWRTGRDNVDLSESFDYRLGVFDELYLLLFRVLMERFHTTGSLERSPISKRVPQCHLEISAEDDFPFRERVARSCSVRRPSNRYAY